MKQFFTTAILILTSSIVFSQSETDFRKVNWGMSNSEVKQIETSELVKEETNSLAYRTDLAGFNALVGYIFAGDKLTRGKYVLLEDHSNRNDFISDFKKLKELLTKKYGNPGKDETIWKNNLYKDDYEDWGTAISIGHLIYYSTWKTDRTEVTLYLSGENYSISTVIEYQSKELGNIEKELREKEQLSELTDSTFRKTVWGASKTQVKNDEKLELLHEDGNILAYQSTVLGFDALIGYIFTGDKLTRGKYIFQEEHSNKSDFISDYESLKKILTKKYGGPKKDQTIWKNDLYKDDYEDWGTAISIGHLLYYSTWETEQSEITLMLSGENYKIDLLIEFMSVELKDYEEKTKEKEVLNDF
ncbi:hypothetical protein [Cyclobacterium amurskyense]|uniref:Uncharacterized protein n=1 Tax=Cyclobacterium amurskyense TaxID=320787 RepID=A0A0H4PI21_9BACT|nr:hypothetical protein [Cyclobacterium amurskyense]AKP52690.1 hypothetical protein CA2015_3299 [Cyclobacterium amurskyense]